MNRLKSERQIIQNNMKLLFFNKKLLQFNASCGMMKAQKQEVLDMNWSSKNSIRLSRLCVVLFGAAALSILGSAPWLVKDFVAFSRVPLEHQAGNLLLVTLYIGGVPALYILWQLWRLLENIQGGLVFIPRNVQLLRRISWGCAAGAIICLISGFYYLPFFVVAACGAFMGLIVRVVKNVFQQAVQLQEDADYTI